MYNRKGTFKIFKYKILINKYKIIKKNIFRKFIYKYGQRNKKDSIRFR